MICWFMIEFEVIAVAYFLDIYNLWFKLSFVIFDIQALWLSALSVEVPGCQNL